MATTIDLLPHRAPWLLVDRIVARQESTVVVEKQLSPNDPLLADGTLPEVLVLEALAQAAACLHTEGMGRHRGMLVAVTKFEVHDQARAGETLALKATREATMGKLHRVSGTATVGERMIASAQMTFALEELG
jgi:3-hydroxymyristoyl/3-hydroxydecanoyl-(acyl carrier protein) dehydratase